MLSGLAFSESSRNLRR